MNDRHFLAFLVKHLSTFNPVTIGQSFEHAAINEAARAGIPLAVWGSRLPNQKYPVVGSDNRLGGQLAAAHLAERGRKRIVFLGDERLPEVAHRHDGYRQALRDAGLKAAPERLVRTGFGGPDAEARMAEAAAMAEPGIKTGAGLGVHAADQPEAGQNLGLQASCLA